MVEHGTNAKIKRIMRKPSKIASVWTAVSTGLFLIGYNIGTGSVTTMASAGADYGMSLTWALVLSCVFTFVMLMAFSRYTMVTGESAIRSFREKFGNVAAAFILVSLLLAEITSAMGLMGVSTEVICEWSKPLTASGLGFNRIATAVLICIVLGFFAWSGSQKFFEKILTVFVMLMGLSFIATMFVTIPDASTILHGLKPSIPEGATSGESFLVISGMVGTTMGAILYVMRSILVKDKGWTLKDVKRQRTDAIVSVSMMFVLSFAVMACAAGGMRGEHIENAVQMVGLIKPLAGELASSVFVMGIVSASLSSLFPILLLAPWLISDFKGEKCDLKSVLSRILIYGVLVLSLVVPVFGQRPVKVVLISQTLAMIATPLTVLFMAILLNDKKKMGDKTPSVFENILYAVVILFSTYMAAIGLIGLI